MKVNIVNIGARFNLYRNLYHLLYCTLTDLGHEVRVSDGVIESNALNLLAPPMAFRARELLDALIERRVRYGILGVELFDGYSHLVAPEDPRGDEAFRAFVGHAETILCLFRQDVPLYGAMTNRVRYLRYGFHPGVREIVLGEERPIDVFFFGDMSAYPIRREIHDALAARGLKVVTTEIAGTANAPDDLVRNSRIALAKVNLNIAHGRHASPQRVIYLANNAIMPISNAVEDPDGYLEASRVFADTAALIEGCIEACAAGTWKEDGQRALDVAARHPMADIVEEALDTLRSG